VSQFYSSNFKTTGSAAIESNNAPYSALSRARFSKISSRVLGIKFICSQSPQDSIRHKLRNDEQSCQKIVNSFHPPTLPATAQTRLFDAVAATSSWTQKDLFNQAPSGQLRASLAAEISEYNAGDSGGSW
jgi:hypothetical protein